MYSRKCIVTSEVVPVNKLIRFVLLKDGTIVLEKESRIYGRGAYCKNDVNIINILFERKLLNKSFKTNISSTTYKMLWMEVEEYVKKQQ